MRASLAIAVICSALLFGSCASPRPSAPIAAPPASVAVVYSNPPLSGNPANGFTRNKFMNLVVKHGLFNTLGIRRNGKIVEIINQNEVEKMKKYRENGTAYFFASDRRASTDTREWLQNLDIYFPAENGEVDTYEITDESINPDFKGTAQGEARATFTITYVESPQITYFGCPKCVIDSSGHPSVVSGQSAVFQWSVVNATKVEFYDDAGIVHEAKVSGTFAFPLSGPGFKVFMLRAYDIWGDTVEYRSGIDVAEYNTSCVAGDAPYRAFCIKCGFSMTGPYRVNYSSPGCSDAAAKNNIANPGAGCEIALDNCNGCPMNETFCPE